MFTKRMICALMCVLLLVTAVVPAFADGRPYRYDDNYATISSIGVTAHCEASFAGYTATGIITLTYIGGSSNQLPANDYTTKVTFYITDSAFGHVSYNPSYHVGMYGYFQKSISKTLSISACDYEFYVNGSHLANNDISLSM